METKKLIKLIKATVDKNAVLPVLESVLIKDNVLTVSDLEIVLEVYNTGIKGKGLIHFLDFISGIEMIKDYKIELKKKARIFNETESIELAMDDLKDFPKSPDVSESKRIHIIDCKDFAKIMIAQDFIGNDELRPELTMVRVGEDIVATNAHQMYFEKASKLTKQPYLLPSKVIKLMEIMGDNEIRVTATGNHITLYFKDAQITFRKCEAKFPAYKAVIPERHSTEIEVDKKEFADRVSKALKFANKATLGVVATIHESLYIEGFDLDWGKSYKSDLPIDKTGENLIVEFNGKFMLKILSKIKAEKITLKFTGGLKAILIQDNFILMPIMRNE